MFVRPRVLLWLMLSRSLLPKSAPFKLYLENLKFDIGEAAIQEFFTKRGAHA